ncbi:hypothetical protein ACS0TY_002767 [Phlomoides rotata]
MSPTMMAPLIDIHLRQHPPQIAIHLHQRPSGGFLKCDPHQITERFAHPSQMHSLAITKVSYYIF